MTGPLKPKVSFACWIRFIRFELGFCGLCLICKGIITFFVSNRKPLASDICPLREVAKS
jgi:hypothetical protein